MSVDQVRHLEFAQARFASRRRPVWRQADRQARSARRLYVGGLAIQHEVGQWRPDQLGACAGHFLELRLGQADTMDRDQFRAEQIAVLDRIEFSGHALRGTLGQMDHQWALSPLCQHIGPLPGTASNVYPAGRQSVLDRRVLNVAHQAFLFGVSQVHPAALQRGGAAGQCLVLAIAPYFDAQVQVIRTGQYFLRIGDPLVVVLVVPAPFVTVLVLAAYRHQRIDGVFGMVVQVDDSRVDHPLAVDHRRIPCRIRQGLSRARDRPNLSVGQPDTAIGKHLAGVVHGDHFPDQHQSGFRIPLGLGRPRQDQRCCPEQSGDG